MATKKKKAKALPQGWVVTEHEDGTLSAVKHFTTSELTAYGADQQELSDAVFAYEAKIQSGDLEPA